MAELFRYNQKKNFGIFFDDEKKTIKKFFLTKKKEKKKYFKNEIVGYNWYISQLNKKKLNHLSIKTKKDYLEIPLIIGKKYNFSETFIFQNKKINNVIEHYKLIWPSKLKVPYHGDLTLDNILFVNEKKIFIIDWENFKKKEDWGLDIAFFLLSLIILPALKKKEKTIHEKDLFFFRKIWKENFFNKNFEYLNDPIRYIEKKKLINNFISKIDYNLKKQIFNAIK